MSDKNEPPRPPREKVGPYTLHAVIAHGGSGTVYRATSTEGRELALKVLHARVHSPSDVRRFEREAAIRIPHPNIVEVMDAGSDEGGTLFIALELLDGQPLSARLRAKLLSSRAAVDVGVQVCRGLEAAHSQGIIHRDLKPENLFWCDDGTVKILDFGIALLQARETRMTTTGIVLGTPWYLAPEQARGERVLDTRVDIWGLGAVLYEALAGKAPFDREGALATVLAIVREELRPIRELAPHVPPDLAAVVERCLAKDPAMRWQTAESLRVAFEGLDLTGADDEAGAGSDRTPRLTIAAGEQRVVAVMLASGTRDTDAIKQAIEIHGGTYLPLLGKRAVGLFGGSSSEGDELDRAAAAAIVARSAAEHIAVAAGRATADGAEISGEALRAAERGVDADIRGIAVDSNAARALATRYALEPGRGDVFRLVNRRPTTPIPPPLTGRMQGVSESAPPDARYTSRLELPPVVGRAAELARMEEGLRTCLEEERAVGLVVSGPPGIGKGRLRREMLRLVLAHEPAAQVLLARADPLGRSSALALIAAALRRRARSGTAEEGWPSIEPEASLEERQQAVQRLARSALHDERLVQETAPFLGELLDVEMPETIELEAARGDAQLMADRLRIAIRDWFEGACQQGPMALLVENLQWADAASLEILEELLERLADCPFLLFGTTRHWVREERPSLLSSHDVVWLEPRGLAVRDVATLAGFIAGRQLAEDVVKVVHERTGGNPLFVEQIVLELREQDALDRPVSELPLPVTVEAAIQSRLDHLPHLEKTLCKRATVYGRPFSVQEVEALGTADARALLDTLRKRGFVQARPASRVGAGREYRFRSPLIAEVGYNMLAEDVRAELHRRAAIALSRATSADEEELAFHHERGGEPAEAARHYVSATLTAARRGDSETVLRCSDRALALGAPEEFLYELHMARADALQFLGRFDEQGEELQTALDLAAGPVDRARALSERVIGIWRQGGRREQALRACEQAVTAARAAGDPWVLALARGRQAVLLAYSGELEEARTALEEAEALAEGRGPWLRGLLSAYRGQLANAEGDMGERRAAYAHAVELFREAGDIRRIANNEANLADALNRFGAYAEAEKALREAIATCRRAGHRLAEGYALANTAFALTMMGRTADAQEALVQASAIAATTGAARLQLMCGVYRARALLEQGAARNAVQEALATAAQAEELAQTPHRVAALTIAARASLDEDEEEAGVDLSGLAYRLLQELGGMEEAEAEVYVVHARALRRKGRNAEAEAVEAQGRERLDTLASKIRDGEWRERFRTAVPAHRELLGL